MKSAPFLKFSSGKRGAALIIVLFFVVLLTSLTVVFLSRSLTARQESGGSAGEMKAAVLANSAGEMIIGDLKQEIIDGSTATTYGTATVYTPKPHLSAAQYSTATPAIVGFTPAYGTAGIETDGLANLVKVSKSGLPFYDNVANSNYARLGIKRASASTSSTASLNGRIVTPNRWNSHYLIDPNKLSSMNAATLASITPDWVIVTRQGASTPYANSDVTNLRNPAAANYAVGRFAYAVYNEGGLLDMNAAGFPATDGVNSVGLTTAQTSQKSSAAFADLNQLLSDPTSAASSPLLTKTQINNIVGWRNSYTSQLSANNAVFGAVKFDATSSGNWLNNFATYNVSQTNALSNNRSLMPGFMGPNTNAAANFIPNPGAAGPVSSPSDQAFLSRQELINLTQSLNIDPRVLQYLGTFSRSLEQPSYTPAANRPVVLPGALPALPNEATYLGNNDQVGKDSIVNPPFLSQRVTQTFTRLDGTQAVVGEPLVKTRFPLSRLALVSYKATANSTPGDPIYDRFGLSRSDPSQPWIYNHGSLNGPGGVPYIMPLSLVAASGREPDFAELLKAAITVGALGKGAPNFPVNAGGDNYEYTIDTTVDYQVLHIMANLIDQQDSDSYPTWIQIASGPGNKTDIYGVEDLPYLYRVQEMTVMEQLPSPAPVAANFTASTIGLTSTNAGATRQVTLARQWTYPDGVESSTPITYQVDISNPVGFTTSSTITLNNAMPTATPVAKGSEGKVAYMYVLQVWNPHDTNTATANPANAGLRPARFRVIGETKNPSQLAPWGLGIEGIMTGGATGTANFKSFLKENDGASPPAAYYWPVSKNQTLDRLTTGSGFSFSDAGGTLYREPTLLWNNNPATKAPSGVVGVSQATDINTGKTYYGIVVGEAPIQINVNVATVNANPPATSPGDGDYIVQVANVDITKITPPSTYSQITFSLQYQDPNNPNNWITYASNYMDPFKTSSTAPGISIAANGKYTPNNEWQNPLRSGQMRGGPTVEFDPRSARWGVENDASLGNVSAGVFGGSSGAGVAYLLEQPTPNADVLTNNAGNNAAMRTSDFSVYETQRPRADKGNTDNYSNPGNVMGVGTAQNPINLNPQMHLFGGGNFSASAAGSNPNEYDGLMTQNNPNMVFLSKDNSTPSTFYFDDADGVCRRSMGGYADITFTDTSTSSLALAVTPTNKRIGMPLATANTFGASALGTPTQQTQSRPIVLNRPFRSVSDMSYAFSGTPWKNIDFFTAESGYVALLDTFCMGEPPTNGLVAGKVDLNTRQEPVIQALEVGAYRDEWKNATSPPAYALSPLTSAEATNVAKKLIQYTTDKADVWRGPFSNVSDLVGRYISNMPTAPSPSVVLGTDWYTYTSTLPGTPAVSYAGFTGLLDSTVYADANSPKIQRFREAALRPLVDSGQSRVWNLLIDIVAQTGRYPTTATTLDQFAVEGEKRIWLHVAIDRYTGKVLDQQVEVVAK